MLNTIVEDACKVADEYPEHFDEIHKAISRMNAAIAILIIKVAIASPETGADMSEAFTKYST